MPYVSIIIIIINKHRTRRTVCVCVCVAAAEIDSIDECIDGSVRCLIGMSMNATSAVLGVCAECAVPINRTTDSPIYIDGRARAHEHTHISSRFDVMRPIPRIDCDAHALPRSHAVEMTQICTLRQMASTVLCGGCYTSVAPKRSWTSVSMYTTTCRESR